MKKFESLGKSLTKEQQKKVVGGDETIDPGTGDGSCNSSCVSNRDCPEDRKCASGTCGGQTIYSCHRY
jgi:hypothetical protein